MARKIAVGISYFPLDTSFLRDIKIRRVLMACGANSIAVIIALLSSIYEDEGYYIKLNEDLPFVIADLVGITEGAAKEIINKLVQVGFFDKKLCSKFKILTSKGIQERYLKACERRKEVRIIKNYSLINSSDYTNIIYVDINGIDVYMNKENVDRSTQSIVKESIEEDREIYKDYVSRLNKILKIKISSDFLSKINKNIDIEALIDGISKSKWIQENLNLNTVSNTTLVKISQGFYRDFTSRENNKFKNFEQITDSYSEEELEDIAMQKQQEGFKKLGVDI
ncbi:DNA-binding MarR family transcriptional regulator [Peptoniphilus olsenii]|uniref:DNA-binding MarR family transcriptional regulator n=1 Tax=Peptoniphilus olsenii TaxID=411570 RepID=A0ABV2J9Z7_9FIRM